MSPSPNTQPLVAHDERIYYRDRIRQARYTALADSEGFLEICFAIEDLGSRLLGKVQPLGSLKKAIAALVARDDAAAPLVAPSLFCSFDALYETVREARNDAMHTGAYARRAASSAVELCLLLEDALMFAHGPKQTVAELMVREPVAVEPWHPVAHARRLMLMHSFSNLPIHIEGEWRLLTEWGLARYLVGQSKAEALGPSISSVSEKLQLAPARVVTESTPVDDLLLRASDPPIGAALWLVVDQTASDRLLGVISAFELI
jgi:hypothetical protein